MGTSANGWTALSAGSRLLHRWAVPELGDGTPDRAFTIRRGSVGFLLIHLTTWFHDDVERLDLGIWDDWGWASRPIRDGTVTSNHASGTAIDINATRHPHHVPITRTFTSAQTAAIRKRLRYYEGVIDWGGNWRPENVDGMHFEIAPGTTMADCERVATKMLDTPRGQRMLALRSNARQRRVVLS